MAVWFGSGFLGLMIPDPHHEPITWDKFYTAMVFGVLFLVASVGIWIEWKNDKRENKN